MVVVSFVTLGDAAYKLGVPAPTLRGWADQLEKIGVHYLERNERGERIFYDNDIEIFKFMKEMKEKWGRKTNAHYLASIIDEKFECRREKRDLEIFKYAPVADYEETLNQEEFMQVIKESMTDVINQVVTTVANQIKSEIERKFEELEQSHRQQIEKLQQELSAKYQSEFERLEERRIKQMNDWTENIRNSLKEINNTKEKKGLLSRLFGKK